MLITADRNFYSFALWGKFRETGADLLWRVKSDIRLPVRQQLPDGSWLTVVNGTRKHTATFDEHRIPEAVKPLIDAVWSGAPSGPGTVTA